LEDSRVRWFMLIMFAAVLLPSALADGDRDDGPGGDVTPTARLAGDDGAGSGGGMFAGPRRGFGPRRRPRPERLAPRGDAPRGRMEVDPRVYRWLVRNWNLLRSVLKRHMDELPDEVRRVMERIDRERAALLGGDRRGAPPRRDDERPEAWRGHARDWGERMEKLRRRMWKEMPEEWRRQLEGWLERMPEEWRGRMRRWQKAFGEELRRLPSGQWKEAAEKLLKRLPPELRERAEEFGRRAMGWREDAPEELGELMEELRRIERRVERVRDAVERLLDRDERGRRERRRRDDDEGDDFGDLRRGVLQRLAGEFLKRMDEKDVERLMRSGARAAKDFLKDMSPEQMDALLRGLRRVLEGGLAGEDRDRALGRLAEELLRGLGGKRRKERRRRRPEPERDDGPRWDDGDDF